MFSFGHLRDQFFGKAVIAVDLGGDRRHLGLRELAHHFLDEELLFGQFKVHGVASR